ncbi:MAG: DUF45 domain-containing protein [Flavobacteriaceae bacterium]|nr:DUF45 domain-containing protein [Flavobacteriaceae bacterium]
MYFVAFVFVIDYLIIHELVLIFVSNHTYKFWIVTKS